MRSSVGILLLIGRRHHIRDQGEDCHERKQDKAQGRSERIQPFFHREVIHPVDEQVGTVCVEIPRRVGLLGTQEVEDAEIVELIDERADDDGRRGEEHERERQIPELLEAVCAVQRSSLVHVLARIGQNPRRQEHDGRHADPGAAEEAEKAQRPFGVIGNDGKFGRDPAPVLQQPDDGPAVAEHEVKARERDKTGNGVGEHGKYPPEPFPFQAGGVVEQREAESAEVDEEGRSERPQDIPDEDLAHCPDVFAHREDDFEAIQARPADEFGRNDFAVVGEGDERRKHDGHDVEDAHKDERQRQGQKIELLVEERLTALEKRAHPIALADLARRIDDVAEIGIVRQGKQEHEKDRRDAPCEHGDGVIALDAHDRDALHGAERDEPDEVFDARKDKKEDKSDFQRHEKRAFGELAAEELSQSHERTAQFDLIGSKRALPFRRFFSRFHGRLLCEVADRHRRSDVCHQLVEGALQRIRRRINRRFARRIVRRHVVIEGGEWIPDVLRVAGRRHHGDKSRRDAPAEDLRDPAQRFGEIGARGDRAQRFAAPFEVLILGDKFHEGEARLGVFGVRADGKRVDAAHGGRLEGLRLDVRERLGDIAVLRKARRRHDDEILRGGGLRLCLRHAAAHIRCGKIFAEGRQPVGRPDGTKDGAVRIGEVGRNLRRRVLRNAGRPQDARQIAEEVEPHLRARGVQPDVVMRFAEHIGAEGEQIPRIEILIDERHIQAVAAAVRRLLHLLAVRIQTVHGLHHVGDVVVIFVPGRLPVRREQVLAVGQHGGLLRDGHSIIQIESVRLKKIDVHDGLRKLSDLQPLRRKGQDVSAFGVAHEHVVRLVEHVGAVSVWAVLFQIDILIHVGVHGVDVVFRIPLVEGVQHLLQMARLDRHLVVEYADGGIALDFPFELCHEFFIGICSPARAPRTGGKPRRRKRQRKAEA